MASGEHQHQEASVAGESPDKSKRERSSGETTADGGVVPSDNGRAAKAEPEVESPAVETEGDTASSDGDTEVKAQGDRKGNGEGGGDERLKVAVAAWVANANDDPEGADSGEADEPGEADEADRSEKKGSGGDEPAASGSKGGKAPEGEGDSGQAAPSDLPIRPKPGDGDPEEPEKGGERAASAEGGKSAGAAKGGKSGSKQGGKQGGKPGKSAAKGAAKSAKGAGAAKSGAGAVAGGGDDGKGAEGAEGTRGAEAEVDQPTAMFGVLRPDADRTADADDEEAAARRAEHMTSAFFGSTKRGDEDDEPTAAKNGDKDSADDEGGKDEGGKDAKGGKGEGTSAKSPGSATGSGSEKAAPSGKSTPSWAAVDQPTTTFRAVGPDKGGDEGKAEDKGASDAPSDKGEGAKDESAGAVDQPTAVFRALGADKQDTKGAEEAKGAKGAASDQSAKDAKGGNKEPVEESESERTSQFVPLKSADDAPRAPKKPTPAVPPKPSGKPRTGAQDPRLPLPQAEPSAGGQGAAAASASAAAPSEAGAQPQAEQRPLTEAELTRLQPRPDQAPLDLLAQLTNTPPPPETPLRTAARRVKIWTPLVLLLLVLFVIAQAVRPLPESTLTLTASDTFTFEGSKPSVPWPSEGQAVLDVQGLGSLGSYGEQKPVPIASVAKVMTAYVILRDHPVKKGSDGVNIPVDKKAEDEAGLSAQNESTVEVKEGDKISQREAMEAIMIASANNVARLLARWDAGSEEAFVKKMNAAAKDLGMTNTKYTDPSGLKHSTVSTAADQVKLAKKAMAIDLFNKTVRLPAYTDTKGEKHLNWNRLVPLDGVVGIKTGTTTRAGGNLLFAAEKEIGGTKQLIIGAVLGQYKPSILDTVLGESKKLIDSAQDALQSRKVVQKGDVVGYVDDQLGGKTPVVATKDVSAVGWSGLKVKLALSDKGKSVPHEGAAGDVVGNLTVGDGPGQVRVPVALQDDMSEPSFGSKLTRIL
ncbi:D-alanyl-D-alanine carboxypeptidase [Streptomyces daliensis]